MMKLEEVLPAMRAGRVAICPDGFRHRIINGVAEWWMGVEKQWSPMSHINVLDGWTLEPEPKVEWPKGSLGWACEKAGNAGFIKRAFWKERTLQVYFSTDLSLESATALDWEVVP